MVVKSRLRRRRIVEPAGKRDEIVTCKKKLRDNSAAIKILERLTGRGPALVNLAVDILTTSQTTHDAKVYQSFMLDILRHGGAGLAVLCAASLGKQRVVHLTNTERIGLVGYLKDHKHDLNHNALERLATAYKIPSFNGSQSIFIQIHAADPQSDPRLKGNQTREAVTHVLHTDSVRTERELQVHSHGKLLTNLWKRN